MQELIGFISAVIGIILFIVLRQDKEIYSKMKKVAVNLFHYGSDRNLGRKTYYKYRERPSKFDNWEVIIDFLEKRYNTKAFLFNKYKLPVTVIWENTTSTIAPDLILGNLDTSTPIIFADKSHRSFIKRMEEKPDSPYIHESTNYRLVDILINDSLPKINGALGLYYDNVLTQYGIEWELNKIISKVKSPENLIKNLNRVGALPLRTAIESNNKNPLIDGTSRCASLTISTLFVYKRETGYYCFVKKRSNKVGVSPNMFHVIPAGMFESTHHDYEYEWSIRYNILREFLEELYNIQETISSAPANPEYLFQTEPLPLLLQLFDEKKAELSITGISVDLLGLRTEINTILFVDDISFAKRRKIEINWEYERGIEAMSSGDFSININNLDSFIDKYITANNIVCSGAVTLELGRKWIVNKLNL